MSSDEEGYIEYESIPVLGHANVVDAPGATLTVTPSVTNVDEDVYGKEY